MTVSGRREIEETIREETVRVGNPEETRMGVTTVKEVGVETAVARGGKVVGVGRVKAS